MAKKKKYYVVWEGVEPGVYDNWDECNAQIKGYPGGKFKSFKSEAEAQDAYSDVFTNYIGVKKKAYDRTIVDRSEVIWESLSVDAACSGSPGILEYRGVWTKDESEIFKMGPFEWGTNNVGEFLALVHGLALLQQQKMYDIPIYSDSRTAISWLRNKKVKTTLARKDNNKSLFVLLERAQVWIEKHTWTNQVLKWETKKWGEIPADFGRK